MKETSTWTQPTLDDRIKNAERSIGEFENATKGLREELKALKEQKRLENLDTENKRLNALVDTQAAKIDALTREKARLKGENLVKYYEGYNRGVVDGGYHF